MPANDKEKNIVPIGARDTDIIVPNSTPLLRRAMLDAATTIRSEFPSPRIPLSEAVRRHSVPEIAPSIPQRAVVPSQAAQEDLIIEAQAMADAAVDLEGLKAALAEFPCNDLKNSARNLVFCDGNPQAQVMIVGEAPGREEDRQGKPFIGEAGRLLDRMLAAIDMRRDHSDPARAAYITNILPWRPPQNRDPSAEERAMFRPFVIRHIELIGPDILILMGRISASTLLHGDEAITRIRGQWREVSGRPALPMLHPAYLLRNPAAKREAWTDLLKLKARLGESELNDGTHKNEYSRLDPA